MIILRAVPVTMGCLVFLLTVLNGSFALAETSAFRELKGPHFVVKYTLEDERTLAGRILERAEALYDVVAQDIGYTRYQGFWTWENRVSIILYPDRFAYLRFTGQQAWSKGYATRNSRLFKTKAIVTYNGESEVFSQVLPHEIAHLMWWDHAGEARDVPVWFEEGIAELQEDHSTAKVRAAAQRIIEQGSSIPFEMFMTLDPASLTDTTRATIYYAQALSVIVFLIDRYGQDAFRRLCRELKEKRPFIEALGRAYPGSFSSMSEFETRWKKDMATGF